MQKKERQKKWWRPISGLVLLSLAGATLLWGACVTPTNYVYCSDCPFLNGFSMVIATQVITGAIPFLVNGSKHGAISLSKAGGRTTSEVPRLARSRRLATATAT